MKVLDSMGPSSDPKGSLLIIGHQLDTEHCPGTPLFTAQQPSNFTIQFYWNLQELRKLNILHDWDIDYKCFQILPHPSSCIFANGPDHSDPSPNYGI